jgi:hypothetical protein
MVFMNNFNGDDVASEEVVNWRGENIRFIYEKVLKDDYDSVIEYGCADGNLLRTIKNHVRYVGIDNNRKIIMKDCLEWAHDYPDTKFDCREFEEVIGLYEGYDVSHCVCTLFYMRHSLEFVDKMMFTSRKYVVWDYLCPKEKYPGREVIQTVNGMDVPAYLIPWQPATPNTIYQSVSPLNATRAGFHGMEGQVIFDVFRVDRV